MLSSLSTSHSLSILTHIFTFVYCTLAGIFAKSHALLHTCCHIILPQFVLAKSLLSTYMHMHDVCILVCMRVSFFVRSVSPHNKGIDIDIMHWCVKDD